MLRVFDARRHSLLSLWVPELESDNCERNLPPLKPPCVVQEKTFVSTKCSTGISGFRKLHICGKGVNLVGLNTLDRGRVPVSGDLWTKKQGDKRNLGVNEPGFIGFRYVGYDITADGWVIVGWLVPLPKRCGQSRAMLMEDIRKCRGKSQLSCVDTCFMGKICFWTSGI